MSDPDTSPKEEGEPEPYDHERVDDDLGPSAEDEAAEAPETPAESEGGEA